MTNSLINQNRDLHENYYTEDSRGRFLPRTLEFPEASQQIFESATAEFANSLRRGTIRQKSRSQSPAGLPRFQNIRHKELPSPTQLPFNDPPFESLKFGNIADCKDNVYRPMRFMPQTSIHWQLNLRSATSDVGPLKHVQVRGRSSSRNHSETSPYESKRYPGCEGTSASMWRHLYKPGVTRASLAWETTLRGLSDIRTEDSSFHRRRFSLPSDSIIQSDPKLYYIYSH